MCSRLRRIFICWLVFSVRWIWGRGLWRRRAKPLGWMRHCTGTVQCSGLLQNFKAQISQSFSFKKSLGSMRFKILNIFQDMDWAMLSVKINPEPHLLQFWFPIIGLLVVNYCCNKNSIFADCIRLEQLQIYLNCTPDIDGCDQHFHKRSSDLNSKGQTLIPRIRP